MAEQTYKVITDSSPAFAIHIKAHDEQHAFLRATAQLPTGCPIRTITRISGRTGT